MTDPHTPTPDISSESSKKPPLSKRVIFFGVCTVIALVVFCIANASAFVSVFARIGDVLTPIAIGVIIAYLCNPFLKFYEYVVFRKLKRGGLRRGLSLLLTVLTAVGIIAVIIALLLPELLESIGKLVSNGPTYLNGLLGFVQKIIDALTAKLDVDIDISDVEKVQELLINMYGSMEDAMEKLLKPLQDMVLNKEFIGNIWGFVVGVFNTLKNLILGIFIAFYILASKEKRVAQLRKFRAAYLTDAQDKRVTEITRLVDRTFGGFVKGVLLDALAVGVVTFILCSIFRVSEYNLLIAAICAVTNIIPVFGPFIGAVPASLIVLISNPSKLLLFIILVVVIQQIDGNIICPRIQGNNTGVSSLAVLIAITVMGGLFGIVGMVIGVPIFAVMIELFKQAVEKRLTKRGRPTDTTCYYPANAVGNAEEEVYYEHAHLRYKYDHSKLKVHIDRLRNKLRRKKSPKQDPPADNAPGSDTDQPNA